MSWRRIAAWLLVLAVAVGAWQLLERRGKSTKEAGARDARLVAIARDAVASIAFSRGGGTVALRRENGAWVLTAPVRWRADDAKVESLLSVLVDGAIERVIEPGGKVDPAQYGLGAEATTIEVADSSGTAARLLVGTKPAVGGKAYVSRGSGGEVALAPASVAQLAATRADDVRDRTILPFETVDGIGITRSSPAGTVTLAKEGSGWRVTTPFGDRADGTAADGLLGRLKDLRIASFVADGDANLAVWGLDRPSLTIALLAGGKPERVLLLGGAADEGRRYAMRRGDGAVFTVPGELADAVPADAAAWRDPSPLSFDSGKVGGIRVSWSGKGISLSRSADEWTLAGRPGYPVDRWEVQTLLTTLAGLSATVPPAAIARSSGRSLGEVVLTGEGGGAVDRIVVTDGPRPEVRRIVADSRPGLAFDLPAAAADKVAAYAEPFSVRKKEVFSLDMGRTAAVAVTAGGKEYRLEREGGRWSLAAPTRRKLEERETNDLLWELGAVRASALLAETVADATAQGLDRPSLKVEATPEGGGSVQTLVVGMRQGEDYRVAAGEPAALFLVPAATVERILKAFADLKP